jgi:hypothetical protein
MCSGFFLIANSKVIFVPMQLQGDTINQIAQQMQSNGGDDVAIAGPSSPSAAGGSEFGFGPAGRAGVINSIANS